MPSARSSPPRRPLRSSGSTRPNPLSPRSETRRPGGAENRRCGCARRAASATRCHAITISRNLVAYLGGAGLRNDPKGPLFRTIGRGTGKLTRTGCRRRTPMRWSADEWPAAGIATELGKPPVTQTASPAMRALPSAWSEAVLMNPPVLPPRQASGAARRGAPRSPACPRAGPHRRPAAAGCPTSRSGI